eukprot:TRINITY_DN290_c4_g1_i1.p1 TRINITY_DN290_c4_g1~~TRINITY_DN290_c4_g1_i1.p1  ORF type:complete len:1062 (-),score=209.85 TRINITY_DN290_c4_g1_i1:242-3427(-)
MAAPTVRLALVVFALLLQAAAFAAGSAAAAAAAAAPTMTAFAMDQLSAASAIGTHVQASIATGAKRLRTDKGHFYLGDERVRLWGVNLCFTACFAPYDLIDVAAERMAQVGVNAVRFHHMDSAVYPSGVWAENNSSKLSSEALDHLAYFIAKLAEHGIYSNINMHVDKQWSEWLNLPDWDKLPDQDKLIPFLSPDVKQKHIDYALDILGTKNTHRGGITFAEDPAVAIVELTNEDSLFSSSAMKTMQGLPSYYQDLMQSQFTSYLMDLYGSTTKLCNAWAPANSDQCSGSLSNSACSNVADGAVNNVITKALSEWQLEMHNGATATVTANADGSAHIAVTKVGDLSWYLQLNTANLGVTGNQTYAITFSAKAASSRDLGVDLSQAHDSYNNLGLSDSFTLTTTWASYSSVNLCTASDTNARVSFSFASSAVAFDLKDVSLHASKCDVHKTNIREWSMWSFGTQGTAAGKQYMSDTGNSMVQVTVVDGTNWHASYSVSPLSIESGAMYSASVVCKASVRTNITLSVCQNYSPWACYASTTSELAANTARSVGTSFYALADDTNVRVAVSVGRHVATYEFSEASFAEGGCNGCASGETLQTAALWETSSTETEGRLADRTLFFGDLELSYYEDLRKNIRNKAGYEGLITGTMSYSVMNAADQAHLDFLDNHAYWQHPYWDAGVPAWSSTGWHVNQKSMALNPPQATFWGMSPALANWPATVTEYNHPAPNDYQAETVPMIASWAALQDWDGVFLFAYEHSYAVTSDPTKHAVPNFFDSAYNPAKWGGMFRAGSLIFREQQLPRLPRVLLLQCTPYDKDRDESETRRELLWQQRSSWSPSLMWPSTSWQDWFQHRLRMNLGMWDPSEKNDEHAEAPYQFWNASVGYSVSSSHAIVFAGLTSSASQVAFQWGTLVLSSPPFISLTVTPLDGHKLKYSESVLVVALGRAESTGMIFTDDRTSVETNWGVAPAVIEPPSGTLTLADAASEGDSCTWSRLGTQGLPNSTVTVTVPASGDLSLALDGRSMWYLLSCSRVAQEPSEDAAPRAVVAPCIIFALLVARIVAA